MSDWQIFAAALAVMIPVVAAVRLARWPRWTTAILFAQVAAIPELAFVTFALAPGPPPEIGDLAIAAAVFYGVVFVVLGWSLYERRKLNRPEVTLAMIERQHVAALLGRIAIVLALSAITFIVEPLLAIVNLAANAVWMAVWIPSRWRRVHVEGAVDIAASPQDIFAFICDTGNWPKYREDFVSAEPPGQLRVGTEIVTRVPVVPMSHPNPKLAKFAEVRSVVTSVVPNRSFGTALVGRPRERGASEVSATPAGSRLITEATGVFLYSQAALGMTFEARTLLMTREARLRANIARLKQLFEATPSK